MPFTKTVEVEPYVPSPTPLFDDSRKTHLERELREVQRVIGKMNEAIKEIQDYLGP